MTLRLEPLYDLHLDLKPRIDVGIGPSGERVVVDVLKGEFSGPKLKGHVLESGADWFLLRPDGTGVLDVRLIFETHDKALIYVKYNGLMDMGPTMQARISETGGTTEFGEFEFVTQIQFETGDSRYSWLNSTLAIGEGRMIQHAKAVEHKVYQIFST